MDDADATDQRWFFMGYLNQLSSVCKHLLCVNSAPLFSAVNNLIDTRMTLMLLISTDFLFVIYFMILTFKLFPLRQLRPSFLCGEIDVDRYTDDADAPEQRWFFMGYLNQLSSVCKHLLCGNSAPLFSAVKPNKFAFFNFKLILQ